MISITLPAKYKCNYCGDLFIGPKTHYERRGKYYYVRNACPTCQSTDIAYLGFFERLAVAQKGNKVK
jgi:hypothetical protein